MKKQKHPLTDEEKLILIQDKFRGGPMRKIQEYAENELGMSYDDFMSRIGDYVSSRGNEWISEGPRFEGAELPEEFWDWYELVTGVVVPSDLKTPYVFSCSC